MTIQLNGQTEVLDQPLSILALLTQKGLDQKPTAVELNGQALLPDQFQSTQLSANDKVEFIVIAAGG